MRMKKIILFAVIAAMAVSCAKTGEVNPVSGKAIAFDTWTSNLTKSVHTQFASGSNFAVYGYKETEDSQAKTTVFNGDKVSYDGSSWNYTGVRFWDRTTDKYVFFAVAPYAQNPQNQNIPLIQSMDVETGVFTTKDITFNGVNSANNPADLLVAKRKTAIRANKEYGKQVELNFIPAAALLDVKVKKVDNLTEAVLKIEEIELRNIRSTGHYSNVGYSDLETTLDRPISATVNSVPGLGWTPALDSEDKPIVTSYNNEHGTPIETLPSIAANVGGGVNNAVSVIENLVVMPQVLGSQVSNQRISNGQKLYIKYSISFSNEKSTHEREINLCDFDNTDLAATAGRTEEEQNQGEFIFNWMPNKHYTYYLTINADIITFTASVDNWADVDTFHYIIN